jgi:hypothetical protein
MTNDNRTIGDFLIGRGGPFYELQQRLGLLREDSFRAGSRALLFVGLAWGVPLVLSIVAGNAVGPYEQRPFLLDPWPWARFFVAVGLLVLMERLVEEQLRANLRQFTLAPLLAPSAVEAAAVAVVKALRRRDSAFAEFLCLALAFLASLAPLFGAHEGGSVAWAARTSANGLTLTTAGWWSLLVSSPIFGFLALRWFWRHIVWALLLRDLSTLELRLVVTHPDGHGGLAFIGRYPNIYAGYVFALSCVIAASVFQLNQQGSMELTVYGAVMGIWLALVLSLFALPLTAFGRPLKKLKESAIRASSAQATRHFRALERDVLGQNVSATTDAESTKAADNPDPSKIFGAAQKCSTLPFSREAWLPISVAALVPLIVAGATQLPIKELIKVAKRLLLL